MPTRGGAVQADKRGSERASNSYDNMQLHSAHFRSRVCNDERGALSARTHITLAAGTMWNLTKRVFRPKLNFGVVASDQAHNLGSR